MLSYADDFDADGGDWDATGATGDTDDTGDGTAVQDGAFGATPDPGFNTLLGAPFDGSAWPGVDPGFAARRAAGRARAFRAAASARFRFRSRARALRVPIRRLRGGRTCRPPTRSPACCSRRSRTPWPRRRAR